MMKAGACRIVDRIVGKTVAVPAIYANISPEGVAM